MDLNELFFRHQIAVMRADRAGNRGERCRLGVQADDLASRIGVLQHHLGASSSPLARRAMA